MDVLYLTRVIAFVTTFIPIVWGWYWIIKFISSWRNGENGLTVSIILFITSFTGILGWFLVVYGSYVLGFNPRLWPQIILPMYVIGINIFTCVSMFSLHQAQGKQNDEEESQVYKRHREESKESL